MITQTLLPQVFILIFIQYALQLFTEVEVASGGYLPLTTDTKVNSCLVYTIVQHKKIILNNLFLQRLQYFWAQIPHELLRGESQWIYIFGVGVANQSAMHCFSVY